MPVFLFVAHETDLTSAVCSSPGFLQKENTIVPDFIGPYGKSKQDAFYIKLHQGLVGGARFLKSTTTYQHALMY
jgi:hypothetical protein